MTLTYPLMGISTRAAVDRSKNPSESMMKAVSTVLRREGVRGLYDGLSSSLIGIGVANFVYYFFFEASRDFIVAGRRLRSPHAEVAATLSTVESIIAGLISGTATALVSNPIWVVNTRQTVRVTQPDASAAEPGATTKVVKRLSFLQTLNSVIEKDGVKALWKGIGPALVLVTNPVLQYTVFEQLKNWLLRSRRAKAMTTTEPLLGDMDFFWLGALSKLIATSITYPQIVIKSRQQAMSHDEPGRKKVNVWTAMTDVVQDEGYVATRSPQLCRPVPRHLVQAPPVDPHRRDPVCVEGAPVPHHQVGTYARLTQILAPTKA